MGSSSILSPILPTVPMPVRQCYMNLVIHKCVFNNYNGLLLLYFRNLLNLRNVKGHVCNAYRAYKVLYYTILDALCLLLFMHFMDVEDLDQEICLPSNFDTKSSAEKIEWLDSQSENILRIWFFDNENDIFRNLRDIVCDKDHPENYWTSTLEEGRFRCHHCEKNLRTCRIPSNS